MAPTRSRKSRDPRQILASSMFDNDTFFIALSENQSNVFVRRWTIQASSSVFCLPTYALRSCTVRSGCVLRRTVGPNCKNPPKIRFKKFVKLTNHTCACNDLTNFECEAEATGNGTYVNLKKLVIVNLFSAGFSYLEPLCVAAEKSRQNAPWTTIHF